ncbi:hypothetical protein ACJIZ3_005644 [Penstemon smallii]|uniref:Calmodulin-binding domain-containing protein n=1 Tax=Penstemon smallii TaxID=265156 RepID=A0ABD3S5F8_9LAMI
MESVYSSPDYMRTRKKENSGEGGSENDDIISVSSSTCASSVNGTYTPKGNTTIKNRTNNKKILKNVRSIQRRVKSRTIQPSNDYLLDEYNGSPNYLKATSCSEGKKSNSQSSYRYSGSIFDSSEQNSSHSSHKSMQPRVRNVGILLKKASFKPKRPSSNYSRVSKDVPVDRATYSSTLKDSKFPKPMNHHRESERISAMKVCRYQHCSLHGHCHATHDSVPLPNRFVYKKRRPLKKQNSMSRKSESVSRNKKRSLISGVGSKNDNDSYTEICEKSEIGGFEDGYYNLKESELVEIAFGETSYPERSYEESLNISRKYSPLKQELERIASGLNGYCLKCSCSIREQITDLASSLDNGYGHEIPQNGNSRFSNTPPFEESEIVDEESYKNEGFNKDFPITPVIFDNVTKNNNAFSSDSVSKSTSENSSEVDGEFVSASTPVIKFKESEETQVKDNEGGKLEFSKQRHISMWHLIHHRMSSDLAPVLNKPNEGADGENQDNESSVLDIGTESKDGSEIQEIEIRKLFAIKLVREAIEKILLPEVQDQTSDDQSITSENSPRPEIIEKNQSDACIQGSYGESDADKREVNVPNQKENSLVAEVDSCSDTVKTEKRKSEKKAPKHWSNLKKWILLQRFIKELEKVRKFNPKKPQILPLNPDPEAEKVKLRAQSVDERKKSEEWMLDYALRQAVSQLAPTQKRKVALLVKAFETVAPSEEGSQIQFKIHKIEDNTKDKKSGEINVIEKSKNLSSEEPEESVGGNEKEVISERQNHIKMWHTIYQHVVSGIAEKVGSKLLDESDEEELGDNKSLVISGGDLRNSNETSMEECASTNQKSAFTKTDALKLVKEAVDEILVPETPDESLNSRGKVEEEQISRNEVEPQKAKNWRKLKKLLLLKRSIKALEIARKLKPKIGSLLPRVSDLEAEKIDLKNQMMDERKKAEEWMLDYAVQHIVTKLTPARKRRVAMLVEAFEAVVPLPET